MLCLWRLSFLLLVSWLAPHLSATSCSSSTYERLLPLYDSGTVTLQYANGQPQALCCAACSDRLQNQPPHYRVLTLPQRQKDLRTRGENTADNFATLGSFLTTQEICEFAFWHVRRTKEASGLPVDFSGSPAAGGQIHGCSAVIWASQRGACVWEAALSTASYCSASNMPA